MLTRNPHVLVIDDSDDDVALLNGAVLRARLEWTVRSVKNLPDVIGLLSVPNPGDHAYYPDLIILDLHLGATSGLGVLRWLRSHGTTRAVPIVILTGSKNPELFRLAKEYGSTLILEKSQGLDTGLVRRMDEQCLKVS